VAIKYPFIELTDINLLFLRRMSSALIPYSETHLIPVAAHVISGIAIYTMEIFRDLINEAHFDYECSRIEHQTRFACASIMRD